MSGPRDRGPIPVSALPKRFPFPQVLADVMTRLQLHFDEDTLPRGGRGIFYDLRPDGIHHPEQLTYRKRHDSVGNLAAQGIITPEYVTDRVVLPARRAGLIPESWIADGRMLPPLNPRNQWDDADELEEILQRTLDEARLARQGGQPSHLLLWAEAADLRPRIARVAHEYGVSVESGGGSDGLKIKRRLADQAAARDVPTIVGHLGDYDSAGAIIFNALAEDATAWFDNAEQTEGSALSFVQLGLTEAQAREFDLLDEDGTAEADGIPVPALDQMIRDFIEERQTETPPDEEDDTQMRAEVAKNLSASFG